MKKYSLLAPKVKGVQDISSNVVSGILITGKILLFNTQTWLLLD